MADIPHITYLFGAGASANAMPVVTQLPERLRACRDFLFDKFSPIPNDEFVRTATSGAGYKKIDMKNLLIREFDNLLNNSGDLRTIDTYAKDLLLKCKSDILLKIRFLLSVFFSLEQKIQGLDPRYHSLFVSLMVNTLQFRPGIKFLSWNYDLQMEAAYEKINVRGGSDFALSTFNTIAANQTKDTFICIKLNGGCNFINGDGQHTPFLLDDPFGREITDRDLKDILELTYDILRPRRQERECLNLNFAWARQQPELDKIAYYFDQTEVLVVIGYSFQFFNREIDRAVIRPMKNLRKIYIQDPLAQKVKEAFLSILPESSGIPIFTPDAKDMPFFLPPEL